MCSHPVIHNEKDNFMKIKNCDVTKAVFVMLEKMG